MKDITKKDVHITIIMIQKAISRMCVNSRLIKVISTGILIFMINHSNLIAGVLITVCLYIIDAYYLGLERGFRRQYNTFIKKTQGGNLLVTDLYKVGFKYKLSDSFNALISIPLVIFYGSFLAIQIIIF